MIINSAEIQQTKEWVEVNVKHGNKTFDISIVTVNGKVVGDYKQMSTSYLSYFHEVSDRVRKQHFKAIKEYIEANV